MDTLTTPRPPAPVRPSAPAAGDDLAREVVARYGLGRAGAVTPLPGARRWRLDTAAGSFVVSGLGGRPDERRAREDAELIAAARRVGIAAPEPRRTVDGDVIGRTGAGPVVVYEHVALTPATDVGPAEVGQLLGRLHRVGRADRRALEWWFAEPMTAERWDDLVAALDRAGAPFAAALGGRRDELVALGALVGRARMVQTCHRAVGPDTLRRDADGGLWLVGWGCVGPADPSHELAAVVLRTVGADPVRAGELVTAYRAAGGHGTIDGPGAFSMAIADHGHAIEVAGRRWLASSATPDDRRREAVRVQDLLAGPVRAAAVAALV